MYYLSALEKTVCFIEENLCESFNLEELTRINGFSRCHFSRLFHSFTGYTLSRYIRSRRLTEAAKDMVSSDEKIINIALKYQFSSQDSFTRSFSLEYGISPAKYRKMNSVKILLNPIDMKKIVIIRGGCEVRPEVKIIEKLKVVGLVYEGLNENQEIPLMWQEFLGRVNEINNKKENMKSYGLCEPLEEDYANVNFDESNEVKYLAGVEVTDASDIPKGMTYWEIPHTKYAVFTHMGDTELLGETYKAIYSEWLPESGYEVIHAHDFELYDKDFKPGDPKSKMYIYVPIK